MLTFLRLPLRLRIQFVAFWACILVMSVVLLAAIVSQDFHECLFRTLPWEPC